MKITEIKFINELTREIISIIKEEEKTDWFFLYDVDMGTWSIYSYSCVEIEEGLENEGDKCKIYR